MIYVTITLALLCLLLFILHAKASADYADLMGKFEEKCSTLSLLSAMIASNKSENNSSNIDNKTAALIKLAVSSSSESEARTAAYEACKRLAKKI